MSAAASVRGFTLFEVLVAILVTAVGLLGVAALQLTSLSSGQEGALRTQATAIAQDLASRVRLAGAAQLNTAVSRAAFFPQYLISAANCLPAAPTPVPFCRSNEGDPGLVCSQAQQAAFDIWEVCSAAGQMPEGAIRTLVVNDAAGAGGVAKRLAVAVGWRATETRVGTGEGATAAVNQDTVCAGFGFPAGVTYNCVVVDVIPY